MCTMAMTMSAENTDISGMENVVYIEPCTAEVGSVYTLSVKMKNSVEAEGFGFDLVLPEGITVALNEYGDPIAELSTERTNLNNTNHFDADFKLDGSLNIQAYSSKGRAISGNDGEVALITIQIDEDIELGTYSIQLTNIAISDFNSTTYTVDLVETSIEIVGSSGPTILDETSLVVPEETTTPVDIKVLRTIKAGEWSTICLPFAMTGEEVTAAFGDDVQLADFIDYEVEEDEEENIVKINVNFENLDPTDGMEANYPYLIKINKTEDITEFTANAVIEPDEENAVVEYDNGRTGRNRKVYGTFKGTFHAGTVVPENCLFLNGNNFWYSKGLTTMKAFRAYFLFVEVLTSIEDAKSRIAFSFESNSGTTTGVSEIENGRLKTEDSVYDLTGRRVKSSILNSQSSIQKKGVYVKNGKKVVIR